MTLTTSLRLSDRLVVPPNSEEGRLVSRASRNNSLQRGLKKVMLTHKKLINDGGKATAEGTKHETNLKRRTYWHPKSVQCRGKTRDTGLEGDNVLRRTLLQIAQGKQLVDCLHRTGGVEMILDRLDHLKTLPIKRGRTNKQINDRLLDEVVDGGLPPRTSKTIGVVC